MTREQEIFFEELQYIQKMVIGVALSKIRKYNNIEDMLKDVTYDTIYSLVELVDGYTNKSINYEIINRISGNSLNHEVDLHDYCEDYLDYADI